MVSVISIRFQFLNGVAFASAVDERGLQINSPEERRANLSSYRSLFYHEYDLLNDTGVAESRYVAQAINLPR